jgi:hypothetical protein
MLVVAQNARAESKGRVIEFSRDAHGTPVVATRKGNRRVGTRVTMLMPWMSKDAQDIVSYFQRVLVPEGVELKVNGETIRPRQARHVVEASLLTEVFDGGRWLKPARKTQVRIVPAINGEVPFVYEMGIPICPLEWDQNYNLDVSQRVPMNPNRDAVSVGYLTRVHRATLRVLVDEMDSAGAPRGLGRRRCRRKRRGGPEGGGADGLWRQRRPFGATHGKAQSR